MYIYDIYFTLIYQILGYSYAFNNFSTLTSFTHKTNKSVENHSNDVNLDDKDSKNASSDSNSDKSSKVASSDSKSDKSSKAVLSEESKGRKRSEAKDDMRTDFQLDRDRILHCKSFRRLKHKTQVFLSPEDDHYRTRMTHTLEVAQIARTISRALRLNEDLTEAIALGHDLGHTPFGHAGEKFLDLISMEKSGKHFLHNVHSVRVLDEIFMYNS